MNDPKKQLSKALARAENFKDEFNLQIPILLAPMPNATPPELAAAISNKGGMGACGALFLGAKEIRSWVNDCLLYTSPSPRDLSTSRMPSSA